jgi:hypothetical protein
MVILLNFIKVEKIYIERRTLFWLKFAKSWKFTQKNILTATGLNIEIRKGSIIQFSKVRTQQAQYPYWLTQNVQIPPWNKSWSKVREFSRAKYVILHSKIRWRKSKICWFGSGKWFWLQKEKDVVSFIQ